MGELRFSSKARDDLDEIYEFSLHRFGRRQTDAYFGDLGRVFESLRDRPLIGRAVSVPDSDLRMFRAGSHTVFYRVKDYGVRIIRVLHKRMKPSGARLRAGEDDED